MPAMPASLSAGERARATAVIAAALADTVTRALWIAAALALASALAAALTIAPAAVTAAGTPPHPS